MPPSEPLRSQDGSVGRPRDDKATVDVLKAAIQLAQDGGIARATIERISAVSGVAKATIYRRWPNSAAIVMDAFLAEHGPAIAYRDEGSVTNTFADAVGRFLDLLNGPLGDVLRQLLGAAQGNAELNDAFVERWIKPRRALAAAVIGEAVARGELSPAADPDIIIDAIYGAIYYRLLMPYGELDKGYFERVVIAALRPLLVQSEQSRPGQGTT